MLVLVHMAIALLLVLKTIANGSLCSADALELERELSRATAFLSVCPAARPLLQLLDALQVCNLD